MSRKDAVRNAVRRLLWRLFPPPEVRAVRQHVREFLRRVSPTYPLPGVLQRHALASTRDTEYVLDRVRADRWSPDELALVMLASAAAGLLKSGRYHIHRGVLNGDGHALSSAFTRCVLELQQRGYRTRAHTAEAVRGLRDDIKRLG